MGEILTWLNLRVSRKLLDCKTRWRRENNDYSFVSLDQFRASSRGHTEEASVTLIEFGVKGG